MASIFLKHGHIAIVDDADVPFVSEFKWYLSSDGRYAIAKPYKDGKQPTVYMHRLLMCAKKGQQVDHANGNGLDNRRQNIRLCNQSQNNANIRTGHRASTGFRGVYENPRGTYFAAISINGRIKNLGTFVQKEDAALAYDRAKKTLFGEFAACNFPESS